MFLAQFGNRLSDLLGGGVAGKNSQASEGAYFGKAQRFAANKFGAKGYAFHILQTKRPFWVNKITHGSSS